MTFDEIKLKNYLGRIYKNPANDKLYLITCNNPVLITDIRKWFLISIESKDIYQDYDGKYEFESGELSAFLVHHNWRNQKNLTWEIIDNKVIEEKIE